MNSNITVWEPIINVPVRLYLEGLYHDYNGLRVLLKGEKNDDQILGIHFLSHLGYRNTDESNRLKTLFENPILTTQWPLFTANESEFLKWIIFETDGMPFNHQRYLNYIICTPNDILEIISEEPPVVKWL